MAQPGRALNARHERAPARTLRRERLLAARSQLVVAPAALSGLLDPAARDQATMLEPVKHGIQRRDVERYGPAGARLDAPGNVVTVASAPLELRKHEQLGGALLERGIGDSCHIWDIYIL